ncbi:MAG: metallophosphoesterase [Myxococcota bacterium]
MASRFDRTLALVMLLLSAGELLLLHWALLASRGAGLPAWLWPFALAAIGAVNRVVFPRARRRIHATGLALILCRTWILGSVAALLTGLLLAVVFVVFGGGGWLFDAHVAARTATIWIGGAAVAIGFGSVLWGASVGSHRVRVDPVSLPLRNASPDIRKLRIAHVSDLHIGPLLRPPRLRNYVRRINELEPDLVVITGDIFDFDPGYVEDGCRELAALRSRFGVFAVLGNHDVYTGAEIVAEGIARHTPIRLLRNEWVELDVDGSPLALAGLEDPGVGWSERASEHAALERLAAEIPDGLPSVLLAHRPGYFARAAQLGFPVILSGHTHGGQVAVPLAHHHNPSRLISHWTRGVFVRGASTLYVNRGLGMAGLPLRINCPREIALLRLGEEAI